MALLLDLGVARRFDGELLMYSRARGKTHPTRSMINTGSIPNMRVLSSTSPSLMRVRLSQQLIGVRTTDAVSFIDLTSHIQKYVEISHVQHGSVTLFSRHTTAAIKLNEAEELLLEDFKATLFRLCPVGKRYHHNDMSRRKPPVQPNERENGHSHCMQLLLPTSETIPIIESKLALGTWQRIFLVELDGPREREILVQLVDFIPARPRKQLLKITSPRTIDNRKDMLACFKCYRR